MRRFVPPRRPSSRHQSGHSDGQPRLWHREATTIGIKAKMVSVGLKRPPRLPSSSVVVVVVWLVALDGQPCVTESGDATTSAR